MNAVCIFVCVYLLAVSLIEWATHTSTEYFEQFLHHNGVDILQTKNTSTNKIAYSRDQLLNIGLNVTNHWRHYKPDQSVFYTINKLDIAPSWKKKRKERGVDNQNL
jgi:hypothetical protein